MCLGGKPVTGRSVQRPSSDCTIRTRFGDSCRRGRRCIPYCGKAWLPDHFDRLTEHLEYVWSGAIFLSGRQTVFRRKMISGRWRPAAFFSAGPYDVRTTIVYALMAEGRGEKGSG